MRDRSLGVSLCLVLLSVATVVPGEQETDGRASFVKRLVEALNGRDPGRQKELLHPRSLGCANAAHCRARGVFGASWAGPRPEIARVCARRIPLTGDLGL